MLCENLINLRNVNGLSQEQVAEIVGVSRQAYAKWEKGETIPDIERCNILARYYGVGLDDLMNFDGVKELPGAPMAPAPKGKHIFGTVTVSDRGQIVIPKEAREIFSMGPGTKLVVLGDEGEGLALLKSEVFEATISMALNNARIKVE